MRRKVKAFIEFWQKNPVKTLQRFYIVACTAALAFNVLCGVFYFIAYQTGFYQEQVLSISDFELVGLEILDDHTVVNKTDDAQLIYNGNVHSIKLRCEFSQNPGEFVSFYNRRGNGSFGVNRMEYAQRRDGWYEFDYPVGTKQIRIDTGVEPAIQVSFSEIVINEKDICTMLGFSTSELFYVFVMPICAFLLFDTIIKVFHICKNVDKN